MPAERLIKEMSEVILVRKGRCVAEIFDDDQNSVAEVELDEGDIILLVAGGHGFRLLEDTVLMEIKQGPYCGRPEKEYF